jgi:hypothetical protein
MTRLECVMLGALLALVRDYTSLGIFEMCAIGGLVFVALESFISRWRGA